MNPKRDDVDAPDGKFAEPNLARFLPATKMMRALFLRRTVVMIEYAKKEFRSLVPETAACLSGNRVAGRGVQMY
jgi:hypothetical protein